MRNPLITPITGDVVFGKNKTRIVTKNLTGFVCYFVKEQKMQNEKYCHISTWRDWCKKNNAEVIIGDRSDNA